MMMSNSSLLLVDVDVFSAINLVSPNSLSDGGYDLKCDDPTAIDNGSVTTNPITAGVSASLEALAVLATASGAASLGTSQAIGSYIASTSPTSGGGRHFTLGSTITVNLTGLGLAGELFYARTAMAAWEQVANIHFVEVATSAQISFSDDNDGTNYNAYSSSSYRNSTTISSSSIHISQLWYNSNGGALGTTGVLNSYCYQTYLHELGHALGLGHVGPYNGSATYGTNNIFSNDTWQYSVMSYFNQSYFGGSSQAYITSAMQADIYGMQLLYGVPTYTGSSKFGYGSTVGNEYDLAQSNSFTIYSANGYADLDTSLYAGSQTVNFAAGTFSSVKGKTNNVGLALNTALNSFEGGSGNDTIYVTGQNVNDFANGNAGTDTVYVSYAYGTGYSIVAGGSATNFVMAGAAGFDTFKNIEFIHFSNGTVVSTASLIAAMPAVAALHTNDIAYSGRVVAGYTANKYTDGLNYIASYADLMAAFGANAQAGYSHFLTYGRTEGRVETFDGLDYIASYVDLRTAFGAGTSLAAISAAGASHFINNGKAEGRSTTFNSLDYIASYQDLISAFHVNGDAGALHDIQFGAKEGRQVNFNGLAYLANYTDLMSAFGSNEQAGAAHYILNGSNEKRSTSFDVSGYMAQHTDLTGKYATTDSFLTAYIDTYKTTGHFLT
jgi:serralysin